MPAATSGKYNRLKQRWPLMHWLEPTFRFSEFRAGTVPTVLFCIACKTHVIRTTRRRKGNRTYEQPDASFDPQSYCRLANAHGSVPLLFHRVVGPAELGDAVLAALAITVNGLTARVHVTTLIQSRLTRVSSSTTALCLSAYEVLQFSSVRASGRILIWQLGYSKCA